MRKRLVSIADLARPGGRWIYSRQGIGKLALTADFPVPVAIVSKGRLKVWELALIVEYERRHPEVVDPFQRRRKQRGWRVQLAPTPEREPVPDRPWPWQLALG